MRRWSLAVGSVTFLAVALSLGLWSWKQSEPTKRQSHVASVSTFRRDVPAEGHLKAETATPVTAPIGRTPYRIEWVKDNGSKVDADEVVLRFDPKEIETKLADGKDDEASSKAEISSAKAESWQSTTEREHKAEIAAERLALSQSRDKENTEEIFSRNEVLNSRIDGKLSEERMRHAKRTQQIFRSVTAAQQQLLALQKKAAEITIQQAEESLDKLSVKAPHAGILVYRNPKMQAGDVVYPGQKVAELPDAESMIAEVFVLEADAVGLEVGKLADLIVESAPERVFSAKIKTVDAVAKQRDSELPVQYIAVTLEILDKDLAVMKPGQRVRATLHLAEREGIVVPRNCVHLVDNDMVVYRWNGEEFAETPVKLGPASPGLVLIEEGVEAGDELALRSPASAAEEGEPGGASAQEDDVP